MFSTISSRKRQFQKMTLGHCCHIDDAVRIAIYFGFLTVGATGER